MTTFNPLGQSEENAILETNFTQQHVLVVGDGSLFDEGIISLLATHGTGLLVSHAIYSDDLAVLNIIKADRPDVILVCESDSIAIEQVIDSISIDPIVLGSCIFVLHLSYPVIDIYERPTLKAGKISSRPRSIIAGTTNDLINILSENIQ